MLFGILHFTSCDLGYPHSISNIWKVPTCEKFNINRSFTVLSVSVPNLEVQRDSYRSAKNIYLLKLVRGQLSFVNFSAYLDPPMRFHAIIWQNSLHSFRCGVNFAVWGSSMFRRFKFNRYTQLSGDLYDKTVKMTNKPILVFHVVFRVYKYIFHR